MIKILVDTGRRNPLQAIFFMNPLSLLLKAITSCTLVVYVVFNVNSKWNLRNRFLQFSLLYLAVHSILFLPANMITMYGVLKQETPYAFILSVIIKLGCAIGILISYQRLLKQEIFYVGEAQESNILQRLFHFFIDGFFSLHLFFFPLLSLTGALSYGWKSYVPGTSQFIWFAFLAFFFYQLCFEGFFGQTIGKIFSKSTVKVEGKYWNGIFIRTIARFIPFEGATIFFKDRPLHDILSNTSVVHISKKNHEH